MDFVSNRPQYKFQLDEKPQRGFLVTPFEKVSGGERVAHSWDKMRGQAAFTNFHRHCYVFFCSISLKRETQEARLLSGVVDFPSHVIAHISRGGSRKFRKGWPVQLPIRLFLFC